jgi:gamma-glutamyltranspeptidase/glutathione hydrolase
MNPRSPRPRQLCNLPTSTSISTAIHSFEKSSDERREISLLLINMHAIDSIFCCLAGRSASTTIEPTEAITNEKAVITQQPVPYSDDAADQFVNILQTHKGSRDELHRRLNEVVSANGWTESLAEAILQKMEKLIKEGAKMAQPMADAIKKATDTALEFAKEHPVYTALIAAGTIVAIGVLVIFDLAWVLNALGFAAKGPRLGMLIRSLYFIPF